MSETFALVNGDDGLLEQIRVELVQLFYPYSCIVRIRTSSPIDQIVLASAIDCRGHFVLQKFSISSIWCLLVAGWWMNMEVLWNHC